MHPFENMCRFSECLDSSQDFLVVVGQLLWQTIDYEGAIVHSWWVAPFETFSQCARSGHRPVCGALHTWSRVEWAPALRRPFGELLRPKSSGGRATVSRKLDTVAPNLSLVHLLREGFDIPWYKQWTNASVGGIKVSEAFHPKILTWAIWCCWSWRDCKKNTL